MGKCGIFHNSVKRAVGYTTPSETLLKVDFITNDACLANLIEFSPI